MTAQRVPEGMTGTGPALPTGSVLPASLAKPMVNMLGDLGPTLRHISPCGRDNAVLATNVGDFPRVERDN